MASWEYKDNYNNRLFYMEDQVPENKYRVYVYVNNAYRSKFPVVVGNYYVWTGLMLEDLNNPDIPDLYKAYGTFKKALGEKINTSTRNKKITREVQVYLAYDATIGSAALWLLDRYDNLYTLDSSYNRTFKKTMKDTLKVINDNGYSDVDAAVYNRLLYYNMLAQDRSSENAIDGKYRASYTVTAYLASDTAKTNITVWPVIGSPIKVGEKGQAFRLKGGTADAPDAEFELVEVIPTTADPQVGLLDIFEEYVADSDNSLEDQDPYLNILPSSLEVRVGERKRIIINTNLSNITYTISDTTSNYLEYDSKFREVTGKAVGGGIITFRGYRNDEEVIKSNLFVNVTGSEVADGTVLNTKTKLMMHSRESNTLSILESGNYDKDDNVFSLALVKDRDTMTLATLESISGGAMILSTPAVSVIENSTTGNVSIQGTPFKSLKGEGDIHYATVWQFNFEANFDKFDLELVRHKPQAGRVIPRCNKQDAYFAYNNYLTEIDTPYQDSKFYARCRYVSYNPIADSYSQSVWSNVVEVTAKNTTKTGAKALVKGDGVHGGYYGEVPYGEQDGTYDYLGSYETIDKAATGKDEVLGTSVKATQLVDSQFYPGASVTYNNKYYRVLKKMATSASGSGDSAIPQYSEPGKNVDLWAEDTRQNLPTVEWMLCYLGINYRKHKTYHIDTLSIGLDHITEILNKQTSYLKCVYKGKILYITKDPVLANIAWTDLAKRDAIRGDRTVRAGDGLYKIRLLTKDEYSNLIPKLVDGTLANFTPSELQLEYPAWLDDTIEGSYRDIGIYKDKKFLIGKADPRTRQNIYYRMVLEFIPQGHEPYNNCIGNIITGEEDQVFFHYDYYSDTGYFGLINSGSFITATALVDQIKGDTGININSYDNKILSPGVSWFGFYWQGEVLYAPNDYIYNYCQRMRLDDAGCSYAYDMGNTKNYKFQAKGRTWNVTLPMCFKWMPINTYSNYNDTITNTYVPVTLPDTAGNTNRYPGYGSMYNDLIYRVNKAYVYTGQGGPQRGDRWADYEFRKDMYKTSSIYMRSREWGITNSSTSGTSITGQNDFSRGYSYIYDMSVSDSSSYDVNVDSYYLGWVPFIKLEYNSNTKYFSI